MWSHTVLRYPAPLAQAAKGKAAASVGSIATQTRAACIRVSALNSRASPRARRALKTSSAADFLNDAFQSGPVHSLRPFDGEADPPLPPTFPRRAKARDWTASERVEFRPDICSQRWAFRRGLRRDCRRGRPRPICIFTTGENDREHREMPSSAESPLLRRDPDFRNFALRRNRSLHSLARRGARPRLATLYSIAAIVSRAKRARAVISRFRASVSAELAPCFRAFLLPLGVRASRRH
jgi:hypothetical protein